MRPQYYITVHSGTHPIVQVAQVTHVQPGPHQQLARPVPAAAVADLQLQGLQPQWSPHEHFLGSIPPASVPEVAHLRNSLSNWAWIVGSGCEHDVHTELEVCSHIPLRFSPHVLFT